MDRDILLWVVAHRVVWLDPLFVALSIIGYAGIAWIALAALLARRAGRSRVRLSITIAACVWSSDLIVLAIKALTDRPRPGQVLAEADPLLPVTAGSAMPSGHAASSLAGAVVLAYLVRRCAPGLFLLAAGIAFSRIYAGLHWPSDVLVGAGVGVIVGLIVIALLRAKPGVLPRERSHATRSGSRSRWPRAPPRGRVRP